MPTNRFRRHIPWDVVADAYHKGRLPSPEYSAAHVGMLKRAKGQRPLLGMEEKLPAQEGTGSPGTPTHGMVLGIVRRIQRAGAPYPPRPGPGYPPPRLRTAASPPQAECPWPR